MLNIQRHTLPHTQSKYINSINAILSKEVESELKLFGCVVGPFPQNCNSLCHSSINWWYQLTCTQCHLCRNDNLLSQLKGKHFIIEIIHFQFVFSYSSYEVCSLILSTLTYHCLLSSLNIY